MDTSLSDRRAAFRGSVRCSSPVMTLCPFCLSPGEMVVGPMEWLTRLGTVVKKSTGGEAEVHRALRRVLDHWAKNKKKFLSVNHAIDKQCDTEQERVLLRSTARIVQRRTEPSRFNSKKLQAPQKRAGAAMPKMAASAAKQEAPNIQVVYLHVESSTESDSDGGDNEGDGSMAAASSDPQWMQQGREMEAAEGERQGRAPSAKVSELWLAHMAPPLTVSELWLAHVGL